ncbi:MAG: hypothetical protein HXY52_03445 [Nitrospirae bacterium]|jgi:lipid-binding SYLF domain-containing protein|nr:hypothetical protein [Nitrospirota bacterium]
MFKRNLLIIFFMFFCSTLLFFHFSTKCHAITREEINASVNAAMDRFKQQIKGGTNYLKGAKGVLVIPNITKAGFIIGGKYGQGALLIGNSPVEYYSIAEGSIGWQIGAVKYDMIILFMTEDVLNKFRKSEGWEAGVDAEVTLIDVGTEVSVETLRSQHPIAGFIFDQKGLMGGVSIKGAKFSRITPD